MSTLFANSIELLCVFMLFVPIFAVSPNGDVVGKLSVGYQGWFACKGDGSPRNIWIHWVDWNNQNNMPMPGMQKFETWPDVREYTKTYETGFGNLGNGQPARLFSSYDDQVVDTHFKWMQQDGIDVAALQRFGVGDAQLNGMAQKVMHSAEKFNRKFYIMYDLSGWTNFHTQIKQDWNNTIVHSLKLTASPAYAKQNGKPVVCIWGIGFSHEPDTAETALDVINFFKAQGCYVIGGVPRDWRTGANSKANYQNIYTALNMISPWTVGSYNSPSQAADYEKQLQADHEYLTAHNVDYQPVMFPGSSWSNWHPTEKRNSVPRLHGDFLWQQFVNLRKLGIPSGYIAMFDEYDEGTAIAKTAETTQMSPTKQYFLTLDADGVHVSSDFYLRLSGDGARMMKGEIPLQTEHPTKHIV